MAEETLGVVANFYSLAVEDQNETRKQGRPIFKDVDMVRLRYVGDKNRELHAPANDKFIREKNSGAWLTYADVFGEQFKAYKAGQEYHEQGTPLSEVPFLTEAKRQELRALHVHTLEQLASLPDRAKAALGMGGTELMAKARAMVAAATGSADVTRLAAENDALKNQMASLSAQVSELLAKAHSQPAPTAPVVADEEAGSPFATFSDEDLKAYIKDRSGAAPRGNPSRSTLIRMADELAPKEDA